MGELKFMYKIKSFKIKFLYNVWFAIHNFRSYCRDAWRVFLNNCSFVYRIL